MEVRVYCPGIEVDIHRHILVSCPAIQLFQFDLDLGGMQAPVRQARIRAKDGLLLTAGHGPGPRQCR